MQNQFFWVIGEEHKLEWTKEFSNIVNRSHNQLSVIHRNTISGEQARVILSNSGLSLAELASIWALSDQDKDNALSIPEYLLAKFLILARQTNQPIPSALPKSLLDSLTPRKSSVWYIPPIKRNAYDALFKEYNKDNVVNGKTASRLFSKSGVDRASLAKIWDLADMDGESHLNVSQFRMALHLISCLMKGFEIPVALPQELLFSAHVIKKHKKTASGGTPALTTHTSLTVVPTFQQQQPPKKSSTLVRNSQSPKSGKSLKHAPAASPPNPMEGELPLLLRIEPSMVSRDNLIAGSTFGKVWQGVLNGEVVAVKDINNYRSEKEVEQWKREVQLLSFLQNSDYLVQIKGYCITPDNLTIVMEFMEGGSLYDIIHKQHKVTWSILHKVRVIRHIAKGIESIHKQNVIHRDIKSMNILLDRNGVAKLADLGCSRMVRIETMTIGVGSPLWMAPEVSTAHYSFPSDIFSFGVVLYEVFNEKLPEYKPETKSVVLPKDSICYSLIHDCTRTKPELRPTASKLIDNLDKLLSQYTKIVARLVRNNYPTLGWPQTEDFKVWHTYLLSYEKDTFDQLLQQALNNKS